MMIQSSKIGKNEEDNHLAIFKPGLWQTDFLDGVKNGTIFSSN